VPISVGKVNFDFSGRTVVVTGAARGIGLEIARSFVTAGASVWIADADEGALAAAAPATGARGVLLDVRDSAAVDDFVADVVAADGRIDVLVNNAGLLRDGMLWKLGDEDWDAAVDVSLGGSFKLTRACVPHFRSQSWGRVINVTSSSGLRGNLGQSNYAAAKAGIVGFTKTAARELGRFGVTVNAISPNAKTRMIESVPTDRLAAVEATIPLGRFGEPAEMAGSVMFLASDAAAYVTGVVLRIDGGLAM